MYERFTDTARKSMQLANKVAQRYHHEYVGTEHILLGIVEEGSGVAVTILKDLNVDPKKFRLRVEEIVQNGPDPMTMGKLPQTPRAKKVIEYAMEEAPNLNHNYVGTEHMLLGLLREKEGVAGQVLMDFGVQPDDVRREIVKLSLREPRCSRPAGRIGSARDHLAIWRAKIREFRRPSRPGPGACPLGRRSFHDRSVRSKRARTGDRAALAKEQAQDFERAARLRDQADELKRRRNR